jgi:hypothetical protein
MTEYLKNIGEKPKPLQIIKPLIVAACVGLMFYIQSCTKPTPQEDGSQRRRVDALENIILN